jgi:two-component system chemotaxis response regulator CheY
VERAADFGIVAQVRHMQPRACADRAGRARTRIAMNNPKFSKWKALVVDDDVHMRRLLRSLLLTLGVGRVFEAADGGSGFDKLRDSKPDFVLTDMAMKPVDGIAFTRRIRLGPDSPNPRIPIIMVTGHTERPHVEAARDSGVSEFLAKPVTAQSLLQRLTEIVERPRPFVRCETYFGPDRRRKKTEDHAGPWRRLDDVASDIEIA